MIKQQPQNWWDDDETVAPAKPAATAKAPVKAAGNWWDDDDDAEPAPPASMAPAAKAPPMQPSNGGGMGPVNPMVEMGLNAQRQALIGEAERYRQGKIDQVNAQRRPFQEEPVDVQQVIADMDKSAADRSRREAYEQEGIRQNKESLFGSLGIPTGFDPKTYANTRMAGDAVVEDAAKLGKTAPLNAWNGLVQAGQSTVNLLPDVAQSIMDVGGEKKTEARVPTADFSRARMDIAPEDQSVSGGLLEGLVQFIVARKAVGSAAPGGGIVPQIGKDALAVGVGFDGSTGRVADMIDPNAIPEGPLRDYAQFLRTQPDDSPLVGRFKNLLEDLTVSGPMAVPQAAVAPAARALGNAINPPAIPTNAGGNWRNAPAAGSPPPASAVHPTAPAAPPVQPQAAAPPGAPPGAPPASAPVQTATAPPVPPQPPVGGPPVAAGAAGNPPGVPVAQAAQTPPPGTLTPSGNGVAVDSFNALPVKTREGVLRALEASGMTRPQAFDAIRSLNDLPPDRANMFEFELIRRFGGPDRFPNLQANLTAMGSDFAMQTGRKGGSPQEVMNKSLLDQAQSEGEYLTRMAEDIFGEGKVATKEQLDTYRTTLGGKYQDILSQTYPGLARKRNPQVRATEQARIDGARRNLTDYLLRDDVMRNVPPWVQDQVMLQISNDLRYLRFDDAGRDFVLRGNPELQPLMSPDRELIYSPQVWKTLSEMYPTQVAHSLQSAYRQAIDTAMMGTDAAARTAAKRLMRMRGQSKVRSNAADPNMRGYGLLHLIEEAAPGYKEVRQAFGDVVGAQKAADMPNNFFRIAKDEEALADFRDVYDNELTPLQQDAVRNGITTQIRQALRNKTEFTQPWELDAAARGQLPNMTAISSQTFLDALPRVFGRDGERMADAIRLSRANVDNIQAINKNFASGTPKGMEIQKNARNLYEAPSATDANPIDMMTGTLASVGGISAATGNLSVALPVLGGAAARGLYRLYKRGKSLSPAQKQALAEWLFKPRRSTDAVPRGGPRGFSKLGYGGNVLTGAAVGAGAGAASSGGDPLATAEGALIGAGAGGLRAGLRSRRAGRSIIPPAGGPRGGNALRGGKAPPAVGPRGTPRIPPGDAGFAGVTPLAMLAGGAGGALADKENPGRGAVLGALGGTAVGYGAGRALTRSRPAGNALKSGPPKPPAAPKASRIEPDVEQAAQKIAEAGGFGRYTVRRAPDDVSSKWTWWDILDGEKKIGDFTFGNNGYGLGVGPRLDPEFQRQGVGTQLYDFIERAIGRPLERGSNLTEAGRALWSARDRARASKPPAMAEAGTKAPPAGPAASVSALPESMRLASTRLKDGAYRDVVADVFTDNGVVVVSPTWPTNAGDDLSNALVGRSNELRSPRKGFKVVDDQYAPAGPPEASPKWSSQNPEEMGDLTKQVADRFVGLSRNGDAHVLALTDEVDLNSLASYLEGKIPSSKQLVATRDGGEIAIVSKRWLRDNENRFPSQQWEPLYPSYNQELGLRPAPAAWASPKAPPASPTVKGPATEEASRLERQREWGKGYQVFEGVHATTKDFDAFDPAMASTRDPGWHGRGHYFAPVDDKFKRTYGGDRDGYFWGNADYPNGPSKGPSAKDGANSRPVLIRMKKPFTAADADDAKIAAAFDRAGYKGIARDFRTGKPLGILPPGQRSDFDIAKSGRSRQSPDDVNAMMPDDARTFSEVATKLGYDGANWRGEITVFPGFEGNIKGKFSKFENDAPPSPTVKPSGAPKPPPVQKNAFPGSNAVVPAAAGAGGATYGWNNPVDANEDGVIDDQDRMITATTMGIGGLTVAGVARTRGKNPNRSQLNTFGGGKGPVKPPVKKPPGYGKVRIAPGVEVLPPDRNALKPNKRKAGKAYPIEGGQSAEELAARKELRDAKAANTRARSRFVMRDNREALWAEADAREARAMDNLNRVLEEQAGKRQKSAKMRDAYYGVKDFVNSERGGLAAGAGVSLGTLGLIGGGAMMLSGDGGKKKQGGAMAPTDPAYFMSNLKGNKDNLAAVQGALVDVGLLADGDDDGNWGKRTSDAINAWLSRQPDRNPNLPLQDYEVPALLAKAYGGYQDADGKWYYDDGQPIRFPVPNTRGDMADRTLTPTEVRRMKFEERIRKQKTAAQ